MRLCGLGMEMLTHSLLVQSTEAAPPRKLVIVNPATGAPVLATLDAAAAAATTKVAIASNIQSSGGSEHVLDAATKSADKCYDMLVARYSTMNGSIPPTDRCPNDPQAFWGGPDFGIDFAMQDWTLDPASSQDSWFKSGFEDGAWWHC